MDRNQVDLIKSIQKVGFAVVELQLYLDTHPCDANALSTYNCYVRQQQNLIAAYERMYGPLRSNTSQSCYPWQWINEPWPWEMIY
mgnify:FL=1|jgi:spore coat protein JB